MSSLGSSPSIGKPRAPWSRFVENNMFFLMQRVYGIPRGSQLRGTNEYLLYSFLLFHDYSGHFFKQFSDEHGKLNLLNITRKDTKNSEILIVVQCLYISCHNLIFFLFNSISIRVSVTWEILIYDVPERQIV